MNTTNINPDTIPTSSQIEEPSFNFIYIGIIAIMVIIAFGMKLIKKQKQHKNTIILIGQRYSGKTQLFINLNQGKRIRTVPSIHNNKTTFLLNRVQYLMIDTIGDNISKQQLLQKLNEIHTIIHVIDGSDEPTISDAAIFIYRILINKQYQKKPCNYIIFLNKKDLTEYIGKSRFEQKLQDQIQHIKQTRINTGQDNQNQDDYIKLSKERFKIPFNIVQGSAEQNIKELWQVLEGL